MTLVSLLVFVLVFGLIFWAVQALTTAFKIEDPMKTVFLVALVILAVLALLRLAGLPTGIPIQ